MPNNLAIEALLTAAKSAIGVAWPGVPIFLGQPRTTAAIPYAVLAWTGTQVSFSGIGAGASQVSQRNTFRIVGRFSFPTDPTQQVELLKATQANAVIAQLQPSAAFGGGMLPLVTEVATDAKAPAEAAWELTLTFEVITLAEHH
jgi:hypothetical protein